VYVRQSSPGQVEHHTESQHLQYSLATTAKEMGFAAVQIIDEDLGTTADGTVARPGFQKLASAVVSGTVGAIFCIEASRLARNGQEWYGLMDVCAVFRTILVDPNGVFDPRLPDDRLLLGLKGNMAEYELTLIRQRCMAARQSKAKRGELQFLLPAGYCWNELGQIEMDPDERVCERIRLVLGKFRELGSVRQLVQWLRREKLQLPVIRQQSKNTRIEWQPAGCHNLLKMLHHPIYAGAYAFGRTTYRTAIVGGRPSKTHGHGKPMEEWSVLIRGHHACYISWEEFEQNQKMLAENAHMYSGTRKSARGGRALLGGLVRCGRCGRMVRINYRSRTGHKYQCLGTSGRGDGPVCIGAGGLRVDQAVSNQIVEVLSEHAVEAALRAAEKVRRADDDVRQSLEKDIEAARYQAALAARRYELVDPAQRLVARQLEQRWNDALEKVNQLEQRVRDLEAQARQQPGIDRESLLALAQDVPAVWNADGVEARTRQRITRILIKEVVLDLDEKANQIVLAIHWNGGRHSEVRLARLRFGSYPDDRHPSAVEVVRVLGGQFPDRQMAIAMNRMRTPTADGKPWTVLAVRELRERLGIAEFDAATVQTETITIDEAAKRLKICGHSVLRLIREGVLPAKQLLPCAPWQIPVAALQSEAVAAAVLAIVERRFRIYSQDPGALKLPGF